MTNHVIVAMLIVVLKRSTQEPSSCLDGQNIRCATTYLNGPRDPSPTAQSQPLSVLCECGPLVVCLCHPITWLSRTSP